MGGSDVWQNAAFSHTSRSKAGNHSPASHKRALLGEIPHFVGGWSANRKLSRNGLRGDQSRSPRSRLLARNNLRTALAILNTRTRWGAGPRIVRDHLHPGLWLEVKTVVRRVHKVGAGA